MPDSIIFVILASENANSVSLRLVMGFCKSMRTFLKWFDIDTKVPRMVMQLRRTLVDTSLGVSPSSNFAIC